MQLPKHKTKPSESLSDYTVLLYGPSKIGKTEFCSHIPDALFLATEPGLTALSVYGVTIGSWETLLDACAEIAKGDHQFKTVVLDTVDNAWRMCQEHICEKHKVDHPADLAYGKGYALVENEFIRVLNKIASLPYGFYMISHSKAIEVETRTGKHQKVIPTLPDKARKFVTGLVDMILYCDLSAKNVSGKPQETRLIRTKPSRHFEAGDRSKRLPASLPLDWVKFTDAWANYTKSADTV